MSPEYMEGRRSDRLPNVTGMWLEGRLPLPSMNLIAALESSFDVVFALFGIGRNATPSGSIINKLRTDRFQSMTILNKLSGKALELSRILRPIQALVLSRLRGVMPLISDGLLNM